MLKDDDFKVLRGFADGQTNERTNEQTFVIVESLSRLKIKMKIYLFVLKTKDHKKSQN